MNGNNKELENAMRVAIKDYDLRNVSDDVLLLCLRIIETNEFNYEFELSENGKLKLLHNMCSFCERTHAEMADVIKMSFNKKDDRYQELFQYSTQTTIDNVMCWGCPLPDCIGNVLGKLLILKKNNLLEEKLRERKNSVGFFKFEFHLKNGLRLVHEDIFQIANHLVKNNLVWVYPFLNKNGNNEVSILTPYTCEQLSQIQKIDDIQNIEISKEHTDWFLTQFDPQKSDELLCEHVECKQKYCPILVAGYMYYLIHSGQGHIIQEDRELYQEHKNEMLRQQIEKTFKDVGLNDISDDVLKFCLQIFNHPKFRYAFELDTTHDRLRVCTNLVPKKLCHKTFNEMVDFFSNRFSPDEIDSYLIEERSGCLSFTIFNKTCQDCHFSKCPYKVLGYLAYLKENRYDKYQSLINRKDPVGFFNFEWKPIDGLKNVSEIIFQIANKMVLENNIKLNSCLDSKDRLLINTGYSCEQITDGNIFIADDLDYITPAWNSNAHTLTRKLSEQSLFDGVCENISCRKDFCPLIVAAYIYYLKMCNQEDIIQSDREYYKQNEEFIIKEITEKHNERLQNLVIDNRELVINELGKFSTQIQNIELLIDSLSSKSENSLYCIVEREEGIDVNPIIDAIAKILFDANKIQKETTGNETRRTRPGCVDVMLTNLEIKRKRCPVDPKMDVPLQVQEGTLDRKTLYVLDRIDDFMVNFRSSPTRTELRDIIREFGKQEDERYIVLIGTKAEVDEFLDLNPKAKQLYNNMRLIVKNLSIDELYNIYKQELSEKAFGDLLINQNSARAAFDEYVTNNRSISPFKNQELSNYLSTYSNSRGAAVFPPDIYKKQTLDESLNGIIGLDAVKLKIKELEQYSIFYNKAKSLGLNIPNTNLHMLFTGNPGSGKTTIARIVAKMLYDIGVLSENKLVEVDRKDLIAKYTGQTASKTAEVIEKAMGGVLFIDEAYSLINDDDDFFGAEAVAALIKAMDDRKGEFVVIFAGYKDEMHDFVNSNPGISSRIGYTFNFPDYSTKELTDIFKIKLSKSGFQYNETLLKDVEFICSKFINRKSFGNGRFVDKILQETLINQANLSAQNNNYNIAFISTDALPTVSELLGYEFADQNIEKDIFKNIVGLDSLKDKIHQLETYVRFVVMANKNGMKMPNINLHMLFTGNPGSGKTTIARIIAKMLFDIGILSENKLVEVERKDLIAKYTGQTASKTAEVIEKAMGGVLFIDEAYSLINDDDDDFFGAEAVATLIKAMEDHKGEFVVIFAVYKDEMHEFVNSNPGISSRIGYTFNFPDYNTAELIEIFKIKLSNMGFDYSDSVEKEIQLLFDKATKRKFFGNGRFVDKLLQEILIKHANNAKNDNFCISLITTDDIPSIEGLFGNSNRDGHAKEMLSSIVGLNSVKEQIYQFESYVKFIDKAKRNCLKIPSSNLHMLFTGNPGCGKTTIARIMANILFDIGILHENKLIEVSRKDLVAEYVGQTAPKTAEVIEKAMGGVLFIDEAYSLTPHDSFRDFGQEAVATLIKAMEDHKGEFVVIFAGYKNEMKHFVNSNPGISSRIGYTFDFPDYSAEELYEIYQLKLKKTGFILTGQAKEQVLKIMKYFYRVENIGNGRFVDRLVQNTLLKHAQQCDNLEDIISIDIESIPTIDEVINHLTNSTSILRPEIVDEQSVRNTSIHEIGHAYVRYKLYNDPQILKITNTAEGVGTLGYVEHKGDMSATYSKTEFLNQIKVLLAGMGCEEIFNGEFESGNISDLQKATSIANDMITKYGMSKLGLGQIENNKSLSSLIQNEINHILDECYQETKHIISENKDIVCKLIDYLLHNKEITGEDFVKQVKSYENE